MQRDASNGEPASGGERWRVAARVLDCGWPPFYKTEDAAAAAAAIVVVTAFTVSLRCLRAACK